MAKPRPKRIPSGNCSVMVDGETCTPHEGEWVELVAAETVGELKTRIKLARLGADIDALRGEPDEGARFQALMDGHYSELVGHLSHRVHAWDWTDDFGQPLPQPRNERGEPDGLWQLRAGELYWLLNATAGESETERKNA